MLELQKTFVAKCDGVPFTIGFQSPTCEQEIRLDYKTTYNEGLGELRKRGWSYTPRGKLTRCPECRSFTHKE